MQNNAKRSVPQRERRRRSVIFIAALFVLIAGFAVLAAFARRTAFFPVDLVITRFLQRFDSWMMAAMKAVSWPGYSPQSFILVALAAAVLALLRFRWEGVATVAASAFEELLNLVVKLLVHRPRPSADLVHVLRELQSFSFPSGHVMFYTVFFGFIFYLLFALMRHGPARTASLTLAALPVALVGAARIYLGEHWFSDTVGAYLLGVITLASAIQFYRWGKNRSFLKKI